MTLTVDLYDIERTGVVNVPDFNSVLMREANGTLLPGEAVERTATGQISRIIVSNQNSGAEISRGLDFGVQYQLETRFGNFTSLTQATYLDAFLFQPTLDVPVTNLRGRVFGETATIADAFLKWKGRSLLDWSWNGFDLNFTANYTDGYHEHKPNALVHWVSQTWIFDTQASYDFTFTAPVASAFVPGYSKDASAMERSKDGKPMESAVTQTANSGLPIWKRLLNGTTITVGCNNVFGEDPPTAYNFGNNASKFPQFIYDPTGRFVYVSLTKKF